MIDFADSETLTPPTQVTDYDFKLCVFGDDNEGCVYQFLASVKKLGASLNTFLLTTNLDLANVVLVYVRDPRKGLKKIRAIRSQQRHFLKPVLAIFEEKLDRKVVEVADDNLLWPADEHLLADKLNGLFVVTSKVEALISLSDSLGTSSIRKILALRFLYTRADCVYRPKRDFQASVGYTFPILRALFRTRPGRELAYLESLEESQLISSKLIDRVNICPHCEHAQINYREICPNCRALKISEETTIHHYRCAYIGKESEFKHGFRLECPKCSRELRHIGVDYDKPSEVMWCDACDHNFSDPLLSCFCLACGKDFTPEHAFVKNINEYVLTHEGHRAAEEGLLPGFGLIDILKKELGFYKHEVFMEFLRVEVFRCTRYKFPSTLATVNLTSTHDIAEDKILMSSRKVRKEFATVIKETFRNTDLFTDTSNGEILVLFTNTTCRRVEIAFNRLNESISKILTAKVILDFKLIDLSSQNSNLDKIWERLN